MAKKEVTVHLADKADVEIGTARCGARLQGAVHTDDREKVTCGKCVSARPKMLVIDDLPPCTHFEFTDGAFCETQAYGDRTSKHLDNVNCLNCLKQWATMETARANAQAAAFGRVDDENRKLRAGSDEIASLYAETVGHLKQAQGELSAERQKSAELAAELARVREERDILEQSAIDAEKHGELMLKAFRSQLNVSMNLLMFFDK